MRAFLFIVVMAGLGGLYYWQKGAGPTEPAKPTPVTQTAAYQTQPVPTASPREPSEHNWMKRSLDRARDVSQQARKNTKDGQDP